MKAWLANLLPRDFGPRERRYRGRLIKFFKYLLFPLSLAMFAAILVWIFVVSGFLGVSVINGRAIFLINAETDRLSFENGKEAHASAFFVQGVRITAEDKLVYDVKADKEHPFCLTGWVAPGEGSRIHLFVRNGLQTARIENADTSLSNATTQFAIQETLSKKKTSDKESSDKENSASETSEEEASEGTTSENLLLLQPDSNEGNDQSERLFVETLKMQGTVQIEADPMCMEHADPPVEIAFAPRSEPMFIEGPGQIGRQTRLIKARSCSSQSSNEDCTETAPLRMLDRQQAYLQGEIDILARQTLCTSLLFLKPCHGLFRLGADAVPIPAGASIQGLNGKANPEPSPLVGQVYFDGDFFSLNVSSDANRIAITFPDFPSGSLSYSELRLSLLDRILTDAWVLVATTLALTLFGWVMSVMQIELDRVPDDLGEPQPSTPEPPRAALGEPPGQPEPPAAEVDPPPPPPPPPSSNT